MPSQQVIDEVADDRIGFVTKFGYYAANQRSAATVPLEIDSAVKIAAAMNFCPAMGTPGLFGPNFDEVKFFLQLRIAHDF